jgi:hypothetical protein
VWKVKGNTLEARGGYRTKPTYWRRGFDWRKDKPELAAVAKRLDRDEPLVAAEQANAVFVGTDKPAIMTAIDIPSIGCWEIIAHYSGDRLSFVVSVQP